MYEFVLTIGQALFHFHRYLYYRLILILFQVKNKIELIKQLKGFDI
jgi:hypothetical protein